MSKLIQAVRYQLGLDKNKEEPLPSWTELTAPILAMLEKHKDSPEPNAARLFYMAIKNLSEVADRQDKCIEQQRRGMNGMLVCVLLMWVLLMLPFFGMLFS